MTKNDYEQLFVKLIAQFGVKTYSQDRVNLIFDEVKNVTSSDFDRLVRHFIGTAKSAPLVPDFRKAISDLNIKFISSYTAPIQDLSSNKLGWEYPVKVCVWANSRYFYFREGDGIHRFMIKADCQDKELLEEGRVAHDKWVPFFKKITEPGYDGSLGTYLEHMQKAVKKYG